MYSSENSSFSVPEKPASSAEKIREIAFTVQLFAVLQDVAQLSSFVVFASVSPISVAQLHVLCAEKIPALAPYLPFARFAINFEYSNPSDLVASTDEIAILPPVSGGCTVEINEAETVEIRPLVALTHQKIDAAEVARSVEKCLHGGAGAVLTFEGIVRDNANGNLVNFLEYFAYEAMALRVLQQVSDEVYARFEVPCAVVHRLGKLEIGEASVVISVATPHRAQAFEACRFAIDRLKAIVPIWKKETARDGSWWVEDPLNPQKTPV